MSTTGQRMQRGLLLQQRFLGLIGFAPIRLCILGLPNRNFATLRRMPADAFVERLNEQIAHEFAAHQQYVAIAVHYDAEVLPRLAAFFYAQALEERNHALMMVRFLLDQGLDPTIPGVELPQASFDDVVAPVELALEQERRVTDQINALAGLAREHQDYTSEQFMQWFIREQTEEIATMSDLLRVVERARENPLLAEEYLAREQPGEEAADPTAPPVAGGAV
jgi:ferritin